MPTGYANIKGGATPTQILVDLINRTGATLTKGDIVACNLAFAAASGQAMVGLDPSVVADGATGYIFGAAIAMTTEAGARIALVYQGDSPLADNKEGKFLLEGIGLVKMNGANAGEFLVPTNAQAYATPYTLTELEALAAVGPICGLALEATTGAQVKRAVWKGWTAFQHSGNVS